MGYRIIVIEDNCKLSYSGGYLIISKEEEEFKEFLDNICSIIVNTLQVTFSSYLLNEIMLRGIRLMFSDSRKNPAYQVLQMNGTFDSYSKRKKQLCWTAERKDLLWTEIIRNKIENQAFLVERLGGNFNLKKYLNMLSVGDLRNAEGYASRSYFIQLFGKDFSRRVPSLENSALNYAYSIVLSLANRVISGFGYSTQFGIHHNCGTNNYNFACDIMEPFRPFADKVVIDNLPYFSGLVPEFKHKLIDIGTMSYFVGNMEYRLENAMEEYFLACVKFLDGKRKKMVRVHELQ